MAESETLTSKQAKFAGLVAGVEGENSMSYAEAYRESYSAENMTDASIYVEASRVANTPKVAAMIASLRVKDARDDTTRDRVNRQWVMNKLQDEATSKANGAAVRVRSLELLGRSMAMFTDKTSRGDSSRSADDIEKSIEERLSGMFDEDDTDPDIVMGVGLGGESSPNKA